MGGRKRVEKRKAPKSDNFVLEVEENSDHDSSNRKRMKRDDMGGKPDISNVTIEDKEDVIGNDGVHKIAYGFPDEDCELERIPIERRISPNYTPNRIQFRGKEKKSILEFISRILESRNKDIGSTLYLLGPPGSGKSILMREILRDIQNWRVTPIYINAMAQPHPRGKNMYMRLAELTSEEGNDIGPETYSSLTEEQLKRTVNNNLNNLCGKKRIVIVLDEVDVFLKEGADVINEVLVAWPTKYGIGVIGIANTLDMDKRMVSRATSERDTIKTIRFKPYSSEELMHMVERRLSSTERENEKYIQKFAIKFCAKKASASGDARDMLEMCNKVISTREDPNVKAGISHAASILKSEGQKSRTLSSVESLPLHSKLVLTALVNHSKDSGSDTILSQNLRSRYVQLCEDPMVSVSPLSFSDFTNVYEMMNQTGILTVKKLKSGKINVGLNIDLTTTIHILRSVKLLKHVV